VTGLFFHKTAPSADLLRHGIRGTARVSHVDESRFGMELNIRRGKVDDILAGKSTPIRKRLTLQIEVPGRNPYMVEKKVAVPVMKAHWVLPGSTVEVLVDPSDAENVAIDWDGAHESGTAAAAIMDSPYAVKALQGMGLDPEQVAREADEARARALEEQPQEPR
jgi:hypothetical protein